jgi:cytochrome c peroxidase
VFRVPSLRNVALTAPYFHDGGAASLEEAVESMARSQLGRSLSGQEIDLIVAFLRSLTGEYRGRPLAPDAGRAP